MEREAREPLRRSNEKKRELWHLVGGSFYSKCQDKWAGVQDDCMCLHVQYMCMAVQQTCDLTKGFVRWVKAGNYVMKAEGNKGKANKDK